MMKKTVVCLVALCSLLCACHETLEERAEREAKEYTEKYCPTPVENFTRTDSVVFRREARAFVYYCSATGSLDNPEAFLRNKDNIAQALLSNLKQSTSLRAYKREGFAFRWVVVSSKDKNTVLFDQQFSPKDYK